MRISDSKPQLDAIDRQILLELQADGRLSNVQLAERVHLSPSACLRRVKQLEESGVIGQYVALLNAKVLGQHGTCSLSTWRGGGGGAKEAEGSESQDVGRLSPHNSKRLQ